MQKSYEQSIQLGCCHDLLQDAGCRCGSRRILQSGSDTSLHNDQQQRDNPVRSAERSIGALRARSEGRNPALTVALPSASMEPAWQAGACLLKAESLLGGSHDVP